MRNRVVIVCSAFLFYSLLTCGVSLAANVCFECHDKAAFQGTVVHKPIADGKCIQCHNPHVAKFEGLLRGQQGKLCYSCHGEKEKTFSDGFVHDPVERGNCSACHNPHSAPAKSLVLENISSSCFLCHEKLSEKPKYLHEPFEKGNCMACHYPHNGKRQLLLKDNPDSLCKSCHEKQYLDVRHKNYPGELGKCLTCHNPHGSERPSLVRNVLHKPYEKDCATCHKGGKVGTSVCIKCHDEVNLEMMATHNHLTRHDGNSCINCHSPHAGDDHTLMRGSQKQICSSCHLTAIKSFRESPYKHNKIDKCVNCHEPHGSTNLSFLKGDGVQVCSVCHESQGAFSHPIGDEVLDNRTGQKMTCVTCHNPMGTDFKFHLVKDHAKDLCILCHKMY